MLYTHAQFEDGSVSVEAGIQDMLIRTGERALRGSSST